MEVLYPSGTKVRAKVSQIDNIVKAPNNEDYKQVLLWESKRKLHLRLEPIDDVDTLEQLIGTPVKIHFNLFSDILSNLW